MSIPYWRLSGFYLFYFATLGCFLPYWSLYLKAKGFNALEIGELTALLVGTKIIAPNIWGWIADRSGRSLRIIRIASLLSALFFSGFLFVDDYLGFACVTVIFSFFWNAALPQFEAVTLFHLKQEPHRYSQIRLWGSVGFIAAVQSVGYLLDIKGLSLLPWIIIGSLTLIWLLSLLTPEATVSRGSDDAVGILHILRKPEVIAFLVVYLLLQMAHGPYYVFYSIYLKQHHYSGIITGFLWSLGVFAEILLFILMHRLLKCLSLRKLLLTSIFLGSLRWLVIAFYVDNLTLLICAQLLHAATFGAAHVTAIHFVAHYFGQQHQGKGQALYSSVSFGVGGMLGSLYGGYFWDIYGPQYVYSMAAAFCLIALVIAYLWVGRNHVKLAIIS